MKLSGDFSFSAAETTAGLECSEIVILYPIILTSAAQIDGLMTHALLDAIEGEPRLRLVGGGLANIEPVDATPNQPSLFYRDGCLP